MKPVSLPVSAQPSALTIPGVVLMMALTLTRWLLPTEATAEGETLWIAGLWFLAGVWLGGWPNRWIAPRHWDLADLGVLLFIGGHVVSGVMVLATSGDRRAAVNLIWEWLSLGVFWFAWRSALRSFSLRRAIIPVLTVTAVTLAIWGLYQYFIWYPQLKAEYLPVIDQFRQAQAAGGDALQLAQKLAAAGIPTEEPGLTLFLNRLRDSQEPFGPFALANTFGGLLAAWLMIVAGNLFLRVPDSAWRVHHQTKTNFRADGGPRQLFPNRMDSIWGLSVVLIAICLYLTNSRTAWAGLLVGICAWLLLIVSRRVTGKVRSKVFPLATLVAAAIGIGLLVLISQEVHAVPGPLKSLAYRAEYWRGTLALLRTSPGFGAGLGQFRDKYLMFKVPESSEEIADPHNLLLDVWANGGLIGLSGLCLLLGFVWFQIWKLSTRSAGKKQAEHSSAESARIPCWIAGLLAFVIVIAGQLLRTGVWDAQVDLLMVFAVVWVAVSFLVSRLGEWRIENCPELAWLAGVVLSVHLLGAGGIAMPAVTQLWLLLIAWGLSAESAPNSQTSSALTGQPGQLRRWLTAACCAVLLIGWYITAERPVWRAEQAIGQGDQWLNARNDREQAKQAYQSAAIADPWSPDPWMRLAHLAMLPAASDRMSDPRSRWDEALKFADDGIARAPFRPLLRIQKGDWLRDIARRTGAPSDWAAASNVYRDAWQRHPTHAAVMAKLAICLSKSGEMAEAAALAGRAIAQDDLNRRLGHTDRYLPESELRQLQAILPADTGN